MLPQRRRVYRDACIELPEDVDLVNENFPHLHALPFMSFIERSQLPDKLSVRGDAAFAAANPMRFIGLGCRDDLSSPNDGEDYPHST